jgi:hypothetical protein
VKKHNASVHHPSNLQVSCQDLQQEAPETGDESIAEFQSSFLPIRFPDLIAAFVRSIPPATGTGTSQINLNEQGKIQKIRKGEKTRSHL